MIDIYEYLLSKVKQKADEMTSEERFFDTMKNANADNDKTVSKYLNKIVKNKEYIDIIYNFIADCFESGFELELSSYINPKKLKDTSKIIQITCIYPDSIVISLINVPDIKGLGININDDKITNLISTSTTKEDLIYDQDAYNEHVYYYDKSPNDFIEEIYEFI